MQGVFRIVKPVSHSLPVPLSKKAGVFSFRLFKSLMFAFVAAKMQLFRI